MDDGRLVVLLGLLGVAGAAALRRGSRNLPGPYARAGAMASFNRRGSGGVARTSRHAPKSTVKMGEQVIRCPYCGSSEQIKEIGDWNASSDDDPGNTAVLTEMQCHNAFSSCGGRSFWV